MDRHSLNIEETVYRVLLEHAEPVFPISPYKIARSMGIQVISRHHAGELLSLLGIEHKLDESPALSIQHSDGYRAIILDADYRCAEWRRMLVAHELAHFAMGHFKAHYREIIAEEARTSALLRSSYIARNWTELNCDAFSTLLLAPVPVLFAAGICSTEDITRLCRVKPILAALLSRSAKARKPFQLSHSGEMVFQKFSAALDRYKAMCRPLPLIPSYMSDISEEFA